MRTIYAERGVVVNLATQQVGEDGFGASARIFGFEDVAGAGYGDRLIGSNARNALIGSGGKDVLLGGGGNDRLNGGSEADTLTGGRGKDTFVFENSVDGFIFEPFDMPEAVDRVTDFTAGEKLLIDNTVSFSTGPFVDKHVFIGTAAFSGARGEIRYEIADGDTVIHVQYGGTLAPDVEIRLSGEHVLTATDFILGG